MKKMFYLLMMALVMFSCNNTETKENCENVEAVEEVTIVLPEGVYALENFLLKADELLDQTVKVYGEVNHTCKHSGRRCFLVSEDGSVTLRVEAGGEIESFDQELIGEYIIVEGVVRERRIPKEDIDQYEKDVEEKEKAEENAEQEEGHCASERNNIAKMREWMISNGKDYYATYFLEGETYEVVE